MKRMHSNDLAIEMIVINSNSTLSIDAGFFAVKDGSGEILWGNSTAEISNSALKINDSGVFASIAATSKCVIPANDFGDPITAPTDIYIDVNVPPFPDVLASFKIGNYADGRKQAAYIIDGKIYGNDSRTTSAEVTRSVDLEKIRLLMIDRAKNLGWYIPESEHIKIPKEYVTVASGNITIDMSEFKVNNLKLRYNPAQPNQTPILLRGEYISW